MTWILAFRIATAVWIMWLGFKAIQSSGEIERDAMGWLLWWLVSMAGLVMVSAGLLFLWRDLHGVSW